MQTRILASLAGALVGFVAAAPVSANFEFPLMYGLIGCPIAGLGLGYMVSILIDVFTAQPAEDTPHK